MFLVNEGCTNYGKEGDPIDAFRKDENSSWFLVFNTLDARKAALAFLEMDRDFMDSERRLPEELASLVIQGTRSVQSGDVQETQRLKQQYEIASRKYIRKVWTDELE